MIFISGSQTITDLTTGFTQRIDNIIAKNLPVITGNVEGVEAAVVAYLSSKGYRNYVQRPNQDCINSASYGLFMWDGTNDRTLKNVMRMKAMGKPSVIYTPFNTELGRPDEPLKEETYVLEGVSNA
jgi:hypothetical protein